MSLWENIHNKRKRIAEGSGEKMRKKGAKGAPTAAAFRKAQGLNKGGMPMKCNCGKGGTCNCGGMAKNKMSKGGMPKKGYGNGGMAKKGYRNGGFCTGPAKGYKK